MILSGVNMSSMIGLLLGYLTVVLLLAAAVSGLHRLFRPASSYFEDRKYKPDLRSAGLMASLALIFSIICILIFAWSGGVFKGVPFEEAMSRVFIRIDARNLMHIAQYGYGTANVFEDQDKMIVYFPLFPLLVNLIQNIGHFGYYTSAIFLQPIFLCVSVFLLHILIQMHFGRKTASFTVLFLLLLPESWFLCTPMTDGLYLMLLLFCFLFIETDHPFYFAVFGFLTALTRSSGVILTASAVTVLIASLIGKQSADKHHNPLAWGFAAIGPLLGLACYLGLNQYYYSDPFAFSSVMKSHWSQGLGLIPTTMKYLAEYAFNLNNGNGWQFSIYVSLLSFIYIPVKSFLVYKQKNRIPLSWLAYTIICIFVTDGATWLLSEARYTLTLPIIPLCLALSITKKRSVLLTLLLLFLLWIILLKVFLNFGPMW